MFDDEEAVAKAIQKLRDQLDHGAIKPREALIQFFDLLLEDQEKKDA